MVLKRAKLDLLGLVAVGGNPSTAAVPGDIFPVFVLLQGPFYPLPKSEIKMQNGEKFSRRFFPAGTSTVGIPVCPCPGPGMQAPGWAARRYLEGWRPHRRGEHFGWPRPTCELQPIGRREVSSGCGRAGKGPVHLSRSHQPGPWKGNRREESYEVLKYSKSAGWREPQPACQTIGSVNEGDFSFTSKCLRSPYNIHWRRK